MTKRSREYAKRVKMGIAARIRQEAPAAEADALRRQLAELRQELEGVAGTLEGIAKTMDNQPRHIIKAAIHSQAKQARATLARQEEVTE